VKQIASAIHSLQGSRENAAMLPDPRCTVVSVARTSLGIQISGSELWSGDERVYQYTLSSASAVMTEKVAKLLVGLIRLLNGAEGRQKLISQGQGVFHLLIRAPSEAVS
jgi:hypothetical protein